MVALLARALFYLLLLALWLAVWTFTIYWTVRLIHAAWNAGPV